MEEFIERIAREGKVYDVMFLDRALISQLKDAPDVKQPLTPETYINEVITNFFQTLKNYEDYEKSTHVNEPS